MVNKEIVTALVAVLERRKAELLIISLRFLRKIAMIPVNRAAVPYDQIFVFTAQIGKWRQADTQNGRHKRITGVREANEILYAFSLHLEVTDWIRQFRAIIDGMHLSVRSILPRSTGLAFAVNLGCRWPDEVSVVPIQFS
jgi:hypothetical protein